MGSMAGTFVGGMFAEYFGYRYAFLGSGILLLVAGLLVFFGAKENFIRPKYGQPKKEGQPTRAFTDLRHVWPILILLATMGFARQFDTSFFPLLVQHILGTMQPFGPEPYRLLRLRPASWQVSSLAVWRTLLAHLKLRSFQPS
jgi:MFS family permease